MEMSEQANGAAVLRMVAPPVSCPSCDAEAGRVQAAGHTSRHCRRHMQEYERQVAARRAQREARIA